MAPAKRARKALETERVFVPLAHYLADDQPYPQLWAARLSQRVLAALSAQRLTSALVPHGARPSFGAPPAPRARTDDSETSFFKLVRQLSADAAAPGHAQHLYVSLRPLH